jgi:hypothetical protein
MVQGIFIERKFTKGALPKNKDLLDAKRLFSLANCVGLIRLVNLHHAIVCIIFLQF